MGVNITMGGRPKIVPRATLIDTVLEVVALIGFLLCIGIIVYGYFNLPDTIPTHVGPSGGIDSYGNKLVLLGVFSVSTALLYGLITVVNRYPDIFNYPTIVTAENAPRLYSIACRLLRWMKVIFVWMNAAAAWLFITVLPYNPGESVNGVLLTIPFFIAMGVVMVYYIVRLLKEGKAPHKVTGKEY